MPFGMINRFAGDHLQNLRKSLSKGYEAVDGQFGGILPGAAKSNVSDLAKSMVIESLPGSQPSPLDKQNKIVNKGVNAAKDIAQGDLVGATVRSHGGTSAGKIREKVAEYGGRKIIRGGAASLAGTAGSIIAPPLAMYEGINLGKDIYSGHLKGATGNDLDEHMAIAGKHRDPLYSRPSEPTHISPSGGDMPEITQGRAQNAILQETKARFNEAASKFNPAQGEWGITELLYGK